MDMTLPCPTQELSECGVELSQAQLAKVSVAPKALDFGHISMAATASAALVVSNGLPTAVHVALDTSTLEGLFVTNAVTQLVPAGGVARFDLALSCQDVCSLQGTLGIVVNGAHVHEVAVLAEIVAATLELSAEELVFGFAPDDWGDSTEQVRFVLQLQPCIIYAALCSIKLRSGAVRHNDALYSVRMIGLMACSPCWNAGPHPG
jgi:hypothetical protein